MSGSRFVRFHSLCQLSVLCVAAVALTSCASLFSNSGEDSESDAVYYSYDCTSSYHAMNTEDDAYKSYGGCQQGTAIIELKDSTGTLAQATTGCRSRGMRLPTVYELSSAALHAIPLKLSLGNYWAASITSDPKAKKDPNATSQVPSTQTCYMPTGVCGEDNPNEARYFRCVTLDGVAPGQNPDNPDQAPMLLTEELFEYDCTESYISDDPGYGPPTTQGGCQNGLAAMEMRDNQGTLAEAHADCQRRGMRLPTYHELSSAGNFAAELKLTFSDYWAASVPKGIKFNQSCYLPTGNCGSQPPESVLHYRCVAKQKDDKTKDSGMTYQNHIALYTYDCTNGATSQDKRFGPYNAQGGCQKGIARMEMLDRRANLNDAYEDCKKRGLRLPTYHELSSAGNVANELGLSAGIYWAADVQQGTKYNQTCRMPEGECGSVNPEEIKLYRCVALEQ